MSRYIITGGAGHIGNNLVRYILKNEPDANITLLLRHSTDIFDGLDVDIRIVDLFDDNIKDVICSADAVIHLAAMIDLSDKRKEEVYKTNYLLTVKLCNICKEAGVRFIYIGSVDGICKDGLGKIHEPEGYYPDKIEGSYGKTKAMASQYVLEKMKSGCEAAIVLPSAVMGINDYKPSEIGSVILNCIKLRPEFGMKGGYNFVDVDDVCFVIYKVLKLKLCGQFIVSGENVSVRELYEKINAFIGRKATPIIIPTFLVRLAMPFVKVLNPITVKSLLEPHDYSSQKAIDELGLKSTPIDETIEKTVQWFRENLKRFD